jgi:S-adenosyl-L-methionine hydrolase (adenosine-forming)
MSIITLTSDMGHRDYYVGALKGSIYKQLPDAKIVDISHEIHPFNKFEAAFSVKNAMVDFPDDTIHLIAIDDTPKININMPSRHDEWPAVMRYKNQYFVALDNGVFSLILGEDEPQSLHRISEALTSPKALQFPAKNILAKIAIRVAKGEPLVHIGEPIDAPKPMNSGLAVIEEHLIRGTVIYIDVYGNLITNVSEDLFKSVGKGEPFTMFFKNRSYFIDKISGSYNEVQQGDRVAVFNSSGLLEIAINQGVPGNGGGASELFGMRLNDVVRIEFTPAGSKTNLEELF